MNEVTFSSNYLIDDNIVADFRMTYNFQINESYTSMDVHDYTVYEANKVAVDTAFQAFIDAATADVNKLK